MILSTRTTHEIATEAPKALPAPAMPVETKAAAFCEKHIPGFRGGDVRKTAAILAAPWTWPVKFFSQSFTGFLDTTYLSVTTPVTLTISEVKRNSSDWQRWTPVERVSVMKQAGLWLVLLTATVWLAMVIPGAFKVIPLTAAALGWYTRTEFDVVRAMLHLPQLPEVRAMAEQAALEAQEAEQVEPESQAAPSELGEAFGFERQSHRQPEQVQL